MRYSVNAMTIPYTPHIGWLLSFPEEQRKQIAWALEYDTPAFRHPTPGANDLKLIAALSRELDRLQINNDTMAAALRVIADTPDVSMAESAGNARRALEYCIPSIAWHPISETCERAEVGRYLFSVEKTVAGWMWNITDYAKKITDNIVAYSISSSAKAAWAKAECVAYYRANLEEKNRE